MRRRSASTLQAPLIEWATGTGVQDAGVLQQYQATLVHPDAGAFRLTGAAMEPSVLRLLRVPPALGRLPSDAPDDAAALVVA